MIRVFAGYDRNIPLGYDLFCRSVHDRASEAVTIAPVRLSQLMYLYTRPMDPYASTEFAITRFLVPWLCNYRGWAIWCDGSDMLCLDDIATLWHLQDDKYAIQVVQNKHDSQESKKFFGQTQSHYERKNWSSLILFNNARCAALTPDEVNTAPGLYLHQFKWIRDEEIGALPSRWNHLVEINPPRKDAAIVHYTLGVPLLRECSEAQYGYAWMKEYSRLLQVKDANGNDAR